MFLCFITSAEPEFRIYDKTQEQDSVTHSVDKRLPTTTIIGIVLSAIVIILGIAGCFLCYNTTNDNDRSNYLKIIIIPIYLMIIYWLIFGVSYYKDNRAGVIIFSILLSAFGIFIWGPFVILIFIILYYILLLFITILYYIFVYPISLIFK